MIKHLRFTCLFAILTALLLFNAFPALADGIDEEAAAAYLYELGLFRGTGTDSSGAPVFELDRSPTRAEALVMLIRLMGLEQEALNSDYPHPFEDTKAWHLYTQAVLAGIIAKNR
ncbi:MAG: hypothetical protein GX940_08325 [Clostridiaceae bacterium]|jgi:hypothetical protein|nr:hypothetical protein [Clostridiaceae bacterium]